MSPDPARRRRAAASRRAFFTLRAAVAAWRPCRRAARDRRRARPLVAGRVAPDVRQRVHAPLTRPRALGTQLAGGVAGAEVEPADVAGRRAVAVARRVVGLVARDRREREAGGPDRPSWTLTVTVTGTSLWSAGHSVRGLAVHEMVGAVLSMRTTSVLSTSALPALSLAEYATVVTPSAVIGIDRRGARDGLLRRLRAGQPVG